MHARMRGHRAVQRDQYAHSAGNASHQTGWDYSAQDNRITFYGQTCEDLKSG